MEPFLVCKGRFSGNCEADLETLFFVAYQLGKMKVDITKLEVKICKDPLALSTIWAFKRKDD